MPDLEDITSANAVAILVVEEIIPAGVQLQHFGTDQSFATNEVTVVENRMGVDGNMAAGWIPSEKTVQITLEPNSPSIPSMEAVARAMENNRRIYDCTLVITIPSINKVYTYSKGVMKSHTPTAGKKILDPTQWNFSFASFVITPN